jgi:hypothetical protein
MRQYASVAIRIKIIHSKGVLQHLFHYYTKGCELQMLTLQRDHRRMKKSCKQNHEYTCTGVCTIWIEDGILSVIFFDVMNRKFKQWWSSIPPISTNRTNTLNLNHLSSQLKIKKDHDIWSRQSKFCLGTSTNMWWH